MTMTMAEEWLQRLDEDDPDTMQEAKGGVGEGVSDDTDYPAYIFEDGSAVHQENHNAEWHLAGSYPECATCEHLSRTYTLCPACGLWKRQYTNTGGSNG
jgi:hypothetical protein